MKKEMVFMKKKIAIVNGPNLNLLGQRQPEIYGSSSFEEYLKKMIDLFPEFEMDYFQSNVEGELINYLQALQGQTQGVVFNPGGYSHTSVALADCIAAMNFPVVEVHLSNIYARESFRHQSITGAQCQGVISGFGWRSYQLALYFLKEIIA